MAFFSFGKKDKNPPEVPPSVAKTQPTPPKIQTPPNTGKFPSVKPPQPTGLMPAAVPSGVATTQPMAMPRTATTGLKPSRPGTSQSTRSTQRIVLPTPPGAKTNNTKPLSMGAPGGRINLPIGMILRCLPPEVLAEDISKFEASGAAATEIGLPMNSILGQLPSGKVEMTLQDLVPHFPAGYLQPTEAIASYLPSVINLPLMDVVMRIPPDLLALRPDQKDVDASVINMADPFTEEILREQAESARRQSQPNIIEESQAPQEEFVPRDKAELIRQTKSIVPPRRPVAEPLNASRTTATTLAAPPMPPVTKLPTPPSVSSPRPNQPAPPTASFSAPALRPPVTSDQIQIPVRSTTVLPPRPPIPGPVQTDPPPAKSTAPVPPVPRHTGAIPAPPPPRHTTSLPPVSRRSGALPSLTPTSAPPLQAPASVPAPPPPPPPDSNSDDLQRLAALAMAQLGDSTDSGSVAAATPPAEAPPAPEPVVAAPPISEPAPAVASDETPIAAFQPTPEVKPEPEVVTAAVTPPQPEPALVAQADPGPPVVSMPAASAPEVAEPETHAQPASVAFNLNTCTVDDLVQNIPDCTRELANAIVHHRDKIGSYKKLEELLDVPGMTKIAYTNLTGEAPPENKIPLSINELLGFRADQTISLKDVTERISCWPDVTGCLLSQSSGLSLVGTAPPGLDKEAIVAFAPRMFESINKSFSEVAGQETDALVIPSSGTSFHLFRSRDLYLIIMSRLPQMPERHMKVARFVLAGLSVRGD